MKKIELFIRKYFSIVFYIAIIILIIVQALRTKGFFMDDGFIMLRYAQNILNGNGWVFNPGEYYNSATSTLYVILHVIQGLIFGVENLEIIGYINFYFWMLVLGIFVYNFFKSYNVIVAALISFSFVMSSHFYRSMGIEAAMNIALLFIALFVYQKKRFNILYPILSLLILTRLENGLFVAIIFLFLLFKDKISPRRLIKKGILISIPFIIWFIFSYFYFGKLFPESLGAKMWQGESGFWGKGPVFFKDMIRYIIFLGLPWVSTLKVPIPTWLTTKEQLIDVLNTNAFFLLALLITGIFTLKGLKSSLSKNLVNGFSILIIWFIVHSFLYGIVFNVPGYPWYFSLALIIVISLYYIGIRERSFKSRYINWALLLILFLPFGSFFSKDVHATIEDVRTIPYHNLSNWINKNTSKDAVIMHEEAGEIAYLTNRRLIDTVALTTPQYLHFLKDNNRTFWLSLITEDKDYYFVSYHDTYAPLREALADRLVYDGQDAIKVRLYKLDKDRILAPDKNGISIFTDMSYKLTGPKDRVGHNLINLSPDNILCNAINSHAQRADEEATKLIIENINVNKNLISFNFIAAYPLEAIEYGTDGNLIEVKVLYNDGTFTKEEIISRVDENNLSENYKKFTIPLNPIKVVDTVELRPYDQNNSYDWLHICNPAFSFMN